MNGEQRLGGDILPDVMGVVPSSRAQIAHLRDLRRVSKEFEQAVDFILVHENWLRPLREHMNTSSPLTRFSYMRENNAKQDLPQYHTFRQPLRTWQPAGNDFCHRGPIVHSMTLVFVKC